MIGTQDAVEAFHHRFDFSVGKDLTRERDPRAKHDLIRLAVQLKKIAEEALVPAVEFQADGDDRLYRAHLVIEEVGELLEALALNNEVCLADALGDLAYVTLGTSVTYAIPLAEVFDEIHRSNMTKSRNKKDPRMKRGKRSPNYSPPDIRKAIESGRVRLLATEK